MHKKLEADLISLAHSILQMKNKDNVFLLKQKSKEIYEKLSVLAFVEEYVNSTPGLKETKEELLEKVEQAFEVKENSFVAEITTKESISVEEKVVYSLVDEFDEEEIIQEVKQEVIIEEQIAVKVEEIVEQPFDELEEIIFSETKTEDLFTSEVITVEVNKTKTLEQELQDTFSVDLMADFFENAQPKSLNDKFAANIQIGLNDRIVFVKNLFNNQQEDYNRVISQLNTFKSVEESKEFINKMVKPDYNWSKHEELEARFLEIIERKFV
ncbi:hypothetical protein [Polaribacter glomeratus]|uniref:Uncharacterized protein n=1 Tax=Polaribacter glomeratus TaxID=102 RepID=A0A2S7WG36_9FLAO|nr:hypothetical protein [Polaribacter glomeratus]PQJ76376.1 hypothetical protein BTO16_10700 [Polaribacter glomeratus]TXD65511.1 hypothetical protein ESX12_10005 [Polaribacter glomeratus]